MFIRTMRRANAILLILSVFAALLLGACKRYKNDVPSYPVQMEMNLLQYPYVTRLVYGGSFQTVSITLYREYYLRHTFVNETIDVLRSEGSYVGYAGMLVWSDINNEFHACDLCCPHCLDRDMPVQVDGQLAICPKCGEEFNLALGYATPTKGITRQPLRPFQIRYSNHILSIRN